MRASSVYPANFKDSAGRVSGGKQTPTNGDKQFGEESHALLVSWPWWFPMRWGNGAKLQHLPCAIDDLSLQLMSAGIPRTWHQMWRPIGNMAR